MQKILAAEILKKVTCFRIQFYNSPYLYQKLKFKKILETEEFRNKWKETNNKIDNHFLLILATLYKTYSKDETDFF